MSPEQVTIHNFYKQNPGSSELAIKITKNPGSFVILYPDEASVQLEELPVEELSLIESVIVIDGTWSQAAAINRATPFAQLRKIKINPALTTHFWRYQNIGPHCLSTIEAIYHFMREYCEARRVQTRNLDDLLYFFSFFYDLIQASYKNNPQRQYTSRHRPDYIKR